MTTTTEAVVAAIRTAGLPISKLSRRERRTGFMVRKVNAAVVSVEFADWAHTDADYAASMTRVLSVLVAAGFRVLNPDVAVTNGIAAVAR